MSILWMAKTVYVWGKNKPNNNKTEKPRQTNKQLPHLQDVVTLGVNIPQVQNTSICIQASDTATDEGVQTHGEEGC